MTKQQIITNLNAMAEEKKVESDNPKTPSETRVVLEKEIETIRQAVSLIKRQDL